MDPKATAFVIVMVVVVVIALLVGIIALIISRRNKGKTANRTKLTSAGDRWYEYLLAALLLIALVVVGALLLTWGISGELIETSAEIAASSDNSSNNTGNWRGNNKATTFLVIIGVGVGLALLVFIIFLLTRLGQRHDDEHDDVLVNIEIDPATNASATANYQTPAATRLLGLLLLVLGILVLGWQYLPAEQQYALLQTVMYPASIAVALVLLFDKATRSWSPKSGKAGLREWLHCDLLVLLLVLGFINLLNVTATDAYRAFFWDILYLALFFLVFWFLDRKLTRYRFLIAQCYLLLVPILLLVWRTVQGLPAVENLSWWSTIWPFFFLALIAVVLEIIILVASRNPDDHIVPAIKDVLVIVIYAVLLLNAIPETVAGSG